MMMLWMCLVCTVLAGSLAPSWLACLLILRLAARLEALYGNDKQLIAQILSVVVTMVYSGVVTLILLLVIRTLIGLRVDPQVEYWGLDVAHHGETIVEYLEGLPKNNPYNTPGKKPAPKKAKKAPAKKKPAKKK